jgi:hypothetical protein
MWVGMAILAAGTDTRGYPTRWVRVWAACLNRGHGYGHGLSPAGMTRVGNLTCGRYPYTHQNASNIQHLAH